ncbi:MAG: hypothetical protein ABSC13_02395 [Dehalococcoidia bacterium]|jgi:hypothetical protein
MNMKKELLLPMLALLLAALAAASCSSSNNSPQSTPTLSAPSATATEADIDSVITQLISDYIHIDDMPIDRTTQYTDASGTEWVRFDVHVPDDALREGVSAGAWQVGLMKRAPGGNWELVDVGVGDIQCGVPSDVQAGLGFDICPPDEEQLNDAIIGWLSSGPAFGIQRANLRIDRKTYYTDAWGTQWVRFSMLPIPDLTSSTYGIMRRIPGGNWEGADFGSALVECSVPADVQVGLGFHKCNPNEDDMDSAITAFVSETSPASRVIVDRKENATDGSGTVWLYFGALVVTDASTHQVFGLMKKTTEGDWEGVVGLAKDERVRCQVPEAIRGNFGCPLAPTLTAWAQATPAPSLETTPSP